MASSKVDLSSLNEQQKLAVLASPKSSLQVRPNVSKNTTCFLKSSADPGQSWYRQVRRLVCRKLLQTADTSSKGQRRSLRGSLGWYWSMKFRPRTSCKAHPLFALVWILMKGLQRRDFCQQGERAFTLDSSYSALQAAKEMKHRLHKTIGDVQVSQLRIGTFHGVVSEIHFVDTQPHTDGSAFDTFARTEV
jgi:hypothetical protein